MSSIREPIDDHKQPYKLLCKRMGADVKRVQVAGSRLLATENEDPRHDRKTTKRLRNVVLGLALTLI